LKKLNQGENMKIKKWKEKTIFIKIGFSGLIIYCLIWFWFIIDGPIPVGKTLTKGDWLLFFGSFLSFAGTILLGIIALKMNKKMVQINENMARMNEDLLRVNLYDKASNIVISAKKHETINKYFDKESEIGSLYYIDPKVLYISFHEHKISRMNRRESYAFLFEIENCSKNMIKEIQIDKFSIDWIITNETGELEENYLDKYEFEDNPDNLVLNPIKPNDKMQLYLSFSFYDYYLEKEGFRANFKMKIVSVFDVVYYVDLTCHRNITLHPDETVFFKYNEVCIYPAFNS